MKYVFFGTAILFFIACKDRKKEAAIEAAKAGYVMFNKNDGNIPFDSVHVKNDTLFYYKEKKFIGSSVIIFEN